jgi:ATP-binding protein involved in chromosome partitioning
LDYLVLDMPPGTGDIQLTTAQKAPVTGAVVVTTPQEIAVSDAQKGLVMFNKVSIPVLGVVENMSMYCCPQCGHEASIFGTGGAAKLCEKYDVDFLGGLPLDPSIRIAADSGCPSVVNEPDSDISRRYRNIAARIGARVAQKARDRSLAFPKIVKGD